MEGLLRAVPSVIDIPGELIKEGGDENDYRGRGGIGGRGASSALTLPRYAAALGQQERVQLRSNAGAALASSRPSTPTFGFWEKGFLSPPVTPPPGSPRFVSIPMKSDGSYDDDESERRRMKNPYEGVKVHYDADGEFLGYQDASCLVISIFLFSHPYRGWSISDLNFAHSYVESELAISYLYDFPWTSRILERTKVISGPRFQKFHGPFPHYFLSPFLPS
jgi:hypothetical protein